MGGQTIFPRNSYHRRYYLRNRKKLIERAKARYRRIVTAKYDITQTEMSVVAMAKDEVSAGG
jgi:hypothetical protein